MDYKEKVIALLNSKELSQEQKEKLESIFPELAEQKPTDKVEPKFKVGDVIRLKGSAAEYTIKRVTDTTYYTDGWSCSIERCEEDYELVEQKSTAWSEEDEMRFNNIFTLLEELPLSQNWLKSLKDRVLPQPKQEWSEEDEQYLLICKNALAKYQVSDKWDAVIISQWLESRLKSLRPQTHWKPSDEQIKVCKEVYADILSAKGFNIGTVNSELNRMEEELKKLREEL